MMNRLLWLCLLMAGVLLLVAHGFVVQPSTRRGHHQTTSSITTTTTTTTTTNNNRMAFVVQQQQRLSSSLASSSKDVYEGEEEEDDKDNLYMKDDSDDTTTTTQPVAGSATNDENDDDDELDLLSLQDEEEEEEDVVMEEEIDDGEYDDEYEDDDDEYEEEEEAPKKRRSTTTKAEEQDWADIGYENDDEDMEYELEDDLENENYMIQKKLIEQHETQLEKDEERMAQRQKSWSELTQAMEADEENYEDYQFNSQFNNETGAFEGDNDVPTLEWNDDIAAKVEKLMSGSGGGGDDDGVNDDFITIQDGDVEQMSKAFEMDDSSEPEPYTMADEEMEKEIEDIKKQKESMNAVEQLEKMVNTKYDGTNARSQLVDVDYVAEIGMSGPDAFDHIPEETQAEIVDCMRWMGCASYNVTKWLVYDLDFNVTNLMLAACAHNPDAPILFEHWQPQLETYERYQYARDRNYGFTWEDCENADMEELKKYYRGFGYYEIPTKKPGETGIIEFGELDEDELKMADFAAWVNEVYNPEWDRKDFDDDKIKDFDNIHSPNFVMPKHPDLPTFEDAQEDLRNWKGEIETMNDGNVTEEQAEYRDMMGEEMEFTYIDDPEFTKAFRGHLIIACTAEDSDLETAEKITIRFEEEFGKQIFVETRIISHALMEDDVYEIWLESYDVELLHSKKRATTGSKDWDGPADCDDEEIEKILERARFLISDEARYSFRMDMDVILN